MNPSHLHVASMHANTTRTSSSVGHGTWTMQTIPVVGPGGNSAGNGGAVATGANEAVVEEARERLEAELDTLRGNKELFLRSYEVCV